MGIVEFYVSVIKTELSCSSLLQVQRRVASPGNKKEKEKKKMYNDFFNLDFNL